MKISQAFKQALKTVSGQKAETLKIGNFVALFISPASGTMAEQFRQAFKG